MDDELIANENSSITNVFTLITQTRNENDRTMFGETSNDFFSSPSDNDGINSSTIALDSISSDVTREGQTWPASVSSFSSTNDRDLMTSSEVTKIVVEEQWFNVNQSHRRDPYRSVLFWKPTHGN